MFFRRKKKKSEELREHYRRSPGKKHALGLTVQLDGAAAVSATLDNLSAGGAGIRFDSKKDPGLEIGTTLTMNFISLGPGKQVSATAVVVGVRGSESEGRLYGVQFADVPHLFKQLDSYLIRFFNRRKALRVLPALGTKLPLRATVAHEEVKIAINDVSWMGMGFLLDPSEAEKFLEADEFDASFSVSKADPPIETTVRLVHKTLTGAKVLFGGYFVNPDLKAGERQRQQLEEYTKKREADMARWDSAV